jgi:hypothetical protein
MLPPNKKLPNYIADCLELRKSSEFGRYIVTNKNLEVGTIIAIEEPFSKILETNSCYERCANCFVKNQLNLLPCNSCSSAMFCSDDCMIVGQEKFHRFLCGVGEALKKLFSEDAIFALFTYFEALHIFNNNTTALNEFYRQCENSDSTVFDYDFSKMDYSDAQKTLLRSIQSLVTHESLRDDRELMEYASSTALLSNLMFNHTKLGAIFDESSRVTFREFILKLRQIVRHNTHAICSYERTLSQTQVGK